MKQLSVYIILIAFIGQTFSKAFLVVEYYSNTAAFARECINKSRPQLHCNGQCLLMKKFKQEENKDRENPERRAENKSDIVLSFESSFPSLGMPLQPAIDSQHSSSNAGKEIKMPRSLFRPPLA